MVSHIRPTPYPIAPQCALSAAVGEWDYLLNETTE